MDKFKIVQTTNENCDCTDHKWVYDIPTHLTFAHPQQCFQERVCSECKQREKLLVEGKENKWNLAKFAKLTKE